MQHICVKRKKKIFIENIIRINLDSGIKRIGELFDVKKKLLEIYDNCNGECMFFIPHVNSMIANHLYNEKKISNNNISIFYEGVALFRPTHYQIKEDSKILFGRWIIGLIVGLKYKRSKYLMPPSLRENANIFSPIVNKDIIGDSKKTFSVEFPILKNIDLCNFLFVGPRLEKENFVENFTKIKEIIQDFYVTYRLPVLYKPDYRTYMKGLNDAIAEIDFNISILSSNDPLEKIIYEVKPKVIASTHFSSVFINLALMKGDNDITLLVPKSVVGEWGKVMSFLDIKTY